MELYRIRCGHVRLAICVCVDFLYDVGVWIFLHLNVVVPRVAYAALNVQL